MDHTRAERIAANMAAVIILAAVSAGGYVAWNSLPAFPDMEARHAKQVEDTRLQRKVSARVAGWLSYGDLEGREIEGVRTVDGGLAVDLNRGDVILIHFKSAKR